jgi:hypothetical protein
MHVEEKKPFWARIVGLYRHSLPLAVTGTIFCLAWFWLNLSDTEYRVPNRPFFAKTAGWFVVGLPFMVPFTLSFGVLLGWIARRRGTRTGWFVLCVIGLPALAQGFHESLPETRVRRIIGPQATSQMSLKSFRQHDTLNEGTFSCGTLAYSDALMAAIQAFRPTLQRSVSTEYDLSVEDAPIPKYLVERFTDDRTHFMVSPDRKELFFVARSRPGPLGIPNYALPDDSPDSER